MILSRLRHWSAQLRVLDERLQRLEDSSAALDERLTRLESSSAALGREVSALRTAVEGEQETLREFLTASRRATEEILAFVSHNQTLAGETLASVNDHRVRGLDLADRAQQALGRVEARQLRLARERSWHENEFRVYSQNGEDGLLQFLFREIPAAPRTFVEFGVEDYREANTRFLLLHDRSWSGLVMDGSAENVAALRADLAYLRYDLRAVAAWVTRDNINGLLRAQGVSGEIGLLSVDIDGNDYWVWEAIDAVDPVVVVVEYNYRFGPDRGVVVPYDPAFDKAAAHPSRVYYGASLAALTALGRRKGYAFVGCCRAGVNAFFVRRDRLPDSVREVSTAEGFVAAQHAEMFDPARGAVVKAGLEEQRDLLLSLPLVEVGAGGGGGATGRRDATTENKDHG